MKYNLPNVLTLFRIAIIPPMIGLFYIPDAWAAWTCLGIYTLGAITDYFDGYFARTMNLMSAFGRFFDPIADKLFVAAVLILLAGFDRIPGIWLLPAIAIMMREFFVAGLREFLGPHKVVIHVTKLAKWKTTAQMFSIGFLIVGNHGDVILPHTLQVGQWALLLSATLTLITGWDYLKVGLEAIRKMDEQP